MRHKGPLGGRCGRGAKTGVRFGLMALRIGRGQVAVGPWVAALGGDRALLGIVRYASTSHGSTEQMKQIYNYS